MASKKEGVKTNKIHIHKEDFKPTKLALKHDPPAIALMYTLGRSSSKQYVHKIDLVPALAHSHNAPEIYQRLLAAQPLYLNPHVIPKKQIIRMIESLLKKSPSKQAATKPEIALKTSGAITTQGPVKALPQVKPSQPERKEMKTETAKSKQMSALQQELEDELNDANQEIAESEEDIDKKMHEQELLHMVQEHKRVLNHDEAYILLAIVYCFKFSFAIHYMEMRRLP